MHEFSCQRCSQSCNLHVFDISVVFTKKRDGNLWRGLPLILCWGEKYNLQFVQPDARYVQAKICLPGHLVRQPCGHYFQSWLCNYIKECSAIASWHKCNFDRFLTTVFYMYLFYHFLLALFKTSKSNLQELWEAEISVFKLWIIWSLKTLRRTALVFDWP